MNQIPNIEEVKKILPCIDPQCDNQGTTITVNSDGEPEQMQCEYCYRERFPILDWHHHQLQKAREEERKRIKRWAYKRATRCAACFGHKEILHNHGQSDISDLLAFINHSELDQDNKKLLQEVISDPEIIKAAAMLGAEDQNRVLDQDKK